MEGSRQGWSSTSVLLTLQDIGKSVFGRYVSSESSHDDRRFSSSERHLDESKQIQELRLSKELSGVLRLEEEGFVIEQSTRSKGLIKVTVPGSLLQGVVSSGGITFSISPSANYPFKPPKLLCHTQFCFPSLADGRNLISSVLDRDWVPSTTYTTIIQRLPRFIEIVLRRIQDCGPRTLTCGIFEGSISLDQYLQASTFSVIPCGFANARAGKATTFLIISEGALVVTDTISQPRIGEVRFWSHLAHILRVSTNQNSHIVTLHMEAKEGLKEKEIAFSFEDANAFISILRHHMEALGVSQSRDITFSIEEELRTLESGTGVSPEYVQRVIQLYRTQIEISSVIDDSYQIALRDMKSFMQHPFVESCLEQSSASSSKESSVPHITG